NPATSLGEVFWIPGSRVSPAPRNDGVLDDDIHDPLRDDDDLFRALAVQRLLYLIEGENGSLNLVLAGLARDGDVGALLAVDLDRQGDRALHQQCRLDLRPQFGGDQGLVAERGPALL